MGMCSKVLRGHPTKAHKAHQCQLGRRHDGQHECPCGVRWTHVSKLPLSSIGEPLDPISVDEVLAMGAYETATDYAYRMVKRQN